MINSQPHNVCTQLAALLDAGLTPTEAFSTLDSPAALAVLHQGGTITAAIEKLGRFSPTELSVLAMGERSGALVQTLNLLAEPHVRSVQHHRKLRAAAVYPIMVLLIASILINTLALLTGEHSLGMYLLQISLLPALLIGGIALTRAMKRDANHHQAMLSVLHRAPFMGAMLQQASTWQFFSAAQILVGAGVGIRSSFQELAAVSADARLVAAIQAWDERLERGMPLSDALYELEVFDAETRQILGNAALSGRMEEALETLTTLHAIAMSSRLQILYTLLPAVSIFAVLLIILMMLAL